MDAHDAILEQLKRAQKRGFEAVTNRLDFVLESLEELIQEAKASVQEALPQEAEELFPVEDVVNAIGDCQARTTQADERIGALNAQLTELGQRLQAAEGRPADAVSLDLLRRLDEARSQSDILRELLPKLSEHAARSVVLVIRGGTISAWSGIGFADGDSLRRWQADVSSSDVFQRFASDGHPLHIAPATDPVLAEWMSDADQVLEALLLPVCLRGKVVGAIYLDHLEDRPWNPETAQVLVALTCWLIDTLSYRQTVPSPMLASPVDLTAETDAPAGEVDAEPTPDPGQWEVEEDHGEVDEDKEPTAESPVVAAEDIPSEAEEMELDEDEGDGYDPSATMRIESPVVPEAVSEAEAEESDWEVEDDAAEAVPEEPVPEAELPPPEPDEPPAELEAEAPVDESPPEVQPVEPPAEVQPVTPPDDFEPPADSQTPEDEARHEEARRFARLLVSEIKLYNEEEVDRGRANNDLYQRLKDDIDRSREMFEKRISPEVRDSRDYFREELIRILADGDADALGM